jgi:hypothetical protein
MILAFTAASDVSAAAPTGAASTAARTVRITGSGFTPGETVDVVIAPGPTADFVIGSPTADSSGNVDLSLSLVTSTGAGAAAAPSLGLRGLLSGTLVVFAPAPDPKPSIWTFLFGLNISPTQDTSSIRDVELASAGFNPESIAIVDVSGNVNLLSQQNRFDLATDTIFSDITFQALSTGPVFATYSLSGIFTNLADPNDFTRTLPPVADSFQFSEQIGNIIQVPEPSITILIGIGLVIILWTSRRKTLVSPSGYLSHQMPAY